MQFTITRNLSLGMALILCLGTASMLAIYQGLSAVRDAMDRLLTAKEPASAAAYEMEIQLHAIASDVLGHLNSPAPHYRDEVRSHAAKFATFLESHRKLVETEDALRLANELERQYGEFRAIGDTLMAERDAQEAFLIETFEKFDGIDRIIDDEIEPRARGDSAAYGPRQYEKLQLLVALEGEVAEVGLSLAHYQRLHTPENRQRLHVQQQQARNALAELQEAVALGDEQRWLHTLESLFDEIMALTGKALALDDRINEDLQDLTRLERDLDRLLDEHIQVAARQDLIAPSKAADEATSEVIRRIGVLVPLFVLAACLVTLSLVWVISAPIKELMAGARAVASGRLTHRLRPRGNDELAQLAHEFNRMLAELESTTVSKTALEASQRRLEELVSQLRQEVADRVRAEEEQKRLHASLRQAETMSAMGSLVAGFAHQVRNPLFGISSVLDAIEARGGEVEAFGKHTAVLRREVERLIALTQELFEYGKSSGLQLAAASISDVIREAASARASLAEERGVRIVLDEKAGVGNLLVDRPRLVRVFENVLENALQHSTRGSEVTVTIRVAEDGDAAIECVVEDAGPGIADEDLPHVLEPFFTRRRGGTGLGLSIVQRIVEEHGGRVVVTNRRRGGAAVVVRLPRSGSQAAAA